jgi:HEAT repeat protein
VAALAEDNSSPAAEALLRVRDVNIDPILSALQNGSLRLNAPLALVLSRSENKKAVGTLLGILEGGQGARHIAAWTLGNLGDARAAQPLARALRDKSRVVRNHAAYALALLKDQGAVDALIDATEDKSRFVGRRAGPIGGREIYMEFIKEKGMRGYIANAPHRTPYASVRNNAIYALGQTGGSKALKCLLALLEHPESSVRKVVVHALSNHVDNDTVVDALTERLDDEQPVRLSVALCLRKRGGAKALKLLREVSQKDPDQLVREAAKQAVEDLGGSGP